MPEVDKVGLIIAVVVIVAALIFIPTVMMGFMYGYRGWQMGRGMMGYGEGMMGFGWGPSILIWLILIVLIVLGIYLFFSSSKAEKGSVAPPEGRAIEILNERYAKGEITREDYLRMKEELKK